MGPDGRPVQLQPKTSFQAQQQANMLGMLEAGQHANHPITEMDAKSDLDNQNLALSKAAAHAKKHDGEREALHLPASHYKLLNREVQEGKDSWLPRLFPGQHTPARDTLASPLKSALLTSLLGAGLGGAGGAGLAHLTGQSPLSGAGLGAGLGGVVGGGLGLAHLGPGGIPGPI
jgi:hypothetical protein